MLIKRIYRIVSLLILMVGIAACAPTQGFINGKWPLLGNDPKATMAQLETIAKNAAIVYDPSITDAEFAEWVARKRYDQRRFIALVDLYAQLNPGVNTEKVTAPYEVLVQDSVDELDVIVATRK